MQLYKNAVIYIHAIKWIFGLLPFLGYYRYCCCKQSCICLLVYIMHTYLVDIKIGVESLSYMNVQCLSILNQLSVIGLEVKGNHSDQTVIFLEFLVLPFFMNTTFPPCKSLPP